MTHAYRSTRHALRTGTALAGAAALAALLLATPVSAAESHGAAMAREAAAHLAAGKEDDPTVVKAPEPNARRVYVYDAKHFAAISQQFIIDGDSARVIGMADGGFMANPVVASDGSFFALANTVFSRIARGQRTDYVEVLDPRTTDPIADIALPDAPRFLVGTYPWMTALTPNNKTMLFYQFSPNPAVGVVDIAGKKFDRLITVPDCYHIFPANDQSFFMHCRDGSLAKVTMGADGKDEVKKTEIFHKESDHLINHPAYSPKNGRLVWPTYTGKLFQIDLSSGDAKFLPTVEALTDEERKDGWAPGGWQQVAYHRATDRIYLLVDQRAPSRHKAPSRFALVIDAKTGKRIKKIELGHEIDSLGVSQDATPQLYALSTGARTLFIFDPETGMETGKVDQLGAGPQVITTADM
ncbi:methylamine dehydrogenase (amicyanin) large subunit [Ancylobacter sp. 6x-1]|uniref:Methylamine dehydrogenase heavy chain n=1 Tax=Ancylobacter crimeensis TaxID=2579147 RepID=A0ABT0DD59_9HYPH|nr:methylamine dehydrogenase (amicyanin) large subunit [Ancylobacter crimeensis]MCK0197908.1 methylamine dehydrogenase (amicyanin) large subunit [Ancylobacter crimeensis]